jgi:hypothetical protein
MTNLGEYGVGSMDAPMADYLFLDMPSSVAIGNANAVCKGRCHLAAEYSAGKRNYYSVDKV